MAWRGSSGLAAIWLSASSANGGSSSAAAGVIGNIISYEAAAKMIENNGVESVSSWLIGVNGKRRQSKAIMAA